MSPPEEIILIDVPSKGTPSCFSPNVWKARAALNYKGIPYTTQWLPYTELWGASATWNVPPNDPSESYFPYSYPAIKLPNGTHVMESLRIAKKLEELQPKPSLHLETDHHQRAIDIITQIQMALVPGIVYRVAEWVLNPADSELMVAERTRQMGAHPRDLAKDPNISGEAAWRKVEPAMAALHELLSENEGPYIMGDQVGFADLVIVAGMKFFEKLDQDGDLHGRLLKYDEKIGQLEKACEEWFRRDD